MSIGIYLIILLIFLYFYLSNLIYKFFIRNKKNIQMASVHMTGENTRMFFFFFFLFCHITRIISLILLTFINITYDYDEYDSLTSFPKYFFYVIIIKSLPTYCFLSAFSIIIVFWSQVYYASILFSFPYLQTFYLFLNILVYTINIILASISLYMKTFNDYISYNYLIQGIIDYLLSICFIYYGVKVAQKLKEQTRVIIKKYGIVKRIISLSIILFIILLIRGIYSLWYFFFENFLFSDYIDLPTSDALIYFISECIPSLHIIYTFKSQNEKKIIKTEYITPLSSDSFDPYFNKIKKEKEPNV